MASGKLCVTWFDCCVLMGLFLAARVVCGGSEGAAVTNRVGHLAQDGHRVATKAAVRGGAEDLWAAATGNGFGGYAKVSLRPRPVGEAACAPPRVWDVRRELQMVVLDGGARLGLQPGMKFAVLRGNKVIAEVEATDVREEITGAAIVSVDPGVFPEKGDRLSEFAGLTK